MLKEIQIQNLVTIQSLQLELLPETTVMTGETGAGKSILVDAIELALGGRASGDLVRLGCEKAEIHLCFDVKHLIKAKTWLKNFELYDISNECILRRTLYRDGRSRCFINGMPTTLQPLRELGELLIQIHGQHEHQSLTKPESQRTLVDQYAGDHHLVETVRTLSVAWHEAATEMALLKKQSADRQARKDLLRFQLNELEYLNLLPNEFTQLENDHKQLAHADELLKDASHALRLLADREESNIAQLLHQTIHALQNIQSFDTYILPLVENLKNAQIQINDTENSLRRYVDNIELDPERLQKIERRISSLFDIARKYKINPNELLDLQKQVATELENLENTDLRCETFSEKLQTVEATYLKSAQALSLLRKKTGKVLSDTITQTLKALALPDATFTIEFEEVMPHTISQHGLEKINFYIQTNLGHAAQPLAKIVSGGELSRIGLAIYLALGDQQEAPTLIFDEIDVGIGGGPAEIVGKLLRRLGENHQILCITHQAQVAARGNQHWRVQKSHVENQVQTRIEPLAANDRIKEIARMLGGVQITQKTLDHAQELVSADV